MSEERELLKRFADSKWNYDDWCFLKADAEELLAQYEAGSRLAQPEQTPVAWMYERQNGDFTERTLSAGVEKNFDGVIIPLYTAPPKQEPLSCREITYPEGAFTRERQQAFDAGVRFAEKAHGIGGGDENDTQHTN